MTLGNIVCVNIFEHGNFTFNKLLKYLLDKHSKLKLQVKKKFITIFLLNSLYADPSYSQFHRFWI